MKIKKFEDFKLNESTTIQTNVPYETNDNGFNFYDANNLKFEDFDVIVGNPYLIFRDSNRGGGKMYDEITISSKNTYFNRILKEEISNHVYIINRNNSSFGISDKVGNFTVNAKTYEDALKVAKTILSIRDRDKKAVLTIKNYSDNKVYNFSN